MESYFSVIPVQTTAAGAALDFFAGWAISKEFSIGTRGFEAVVIAAKSRPQWALEIELIGITGTIELQWGIASVVPEKPDELPIHTVTGIVGSIGPPRLDGALVAGVAAGVMVDAVLDLSPMDMFALGSNMGVKWEVFTLPQVFLVDPHGMTRNLSREWNLLVLVVWPLQSAWIHMDSKWKCTEY
jgi:hypothetical protein